MNRKANVNRFFAQNFHDFRRGVLGLRDCQTVTGNDDDRFGAVEKFGGLFGGNRSDFALFARACGRRTRARFRAGQPGRTRDGPAPAGSSVGHDSRAPVIRTLAGQVRRSGVRREVELDLPRAATRAARPARRARAGDRPRRRPRRGRGGRRHRGAPGRPGPARLRGQRQPRAEDPVGALHLLAEALLDATERPTRWRRPPEDLVAARRFAERIHHESARLARLVKELLELSRLQGAEPLPAPEPVAVDRIVAEVVDRTRTTASAKNIEVDRARPPRPDRLRQREPARHRGGQPGGERDRLLARGHHGPIATMAGRRARRDRRRRPGHRHRAQATSTGSSSASTGPTRPAPGPPAAPGLAWPSSSTSPSTTAAGSTCRALWRWLDVHPAAAGPPTGRRAGDYRRRLDRDPVRLEAFRAASGSNGKESTLARVLVVEDEESFSDALSYMLRKEGFEVAVAATGTDALTEFDRNGADIVLLDLMLPEMSGTEVCRQLRQQLGRADHHGHRPGQRDRQGGRAGDRRRRLRHQAVLAAGAGRPDPGGAAPAGPRRPRRVAPTLAAGPVRMDVERHVVTVAGDACSCR